jgi:capsular polysaccharide export protein
MNSDKNFPIFKNKIKIQGNCLFLIGPIGTFFARLSNFLEKNNVQTYKILFPLYEYGFPKSRLIKFHQDIYLFKNYLKKILIEKEIKHIFMYGNVLIPHREALALVEELKKEEIHVKTHIFELGYLRPNFVTLEDKGINYSSGLIKSREFYLKQESYKFFPIPKKHARFRIRKIWKSISFINHSFKNYKIVNKEHKLQPKPIYIWYQIKGFFLKYYFRLSEYKLKKKCFYENKFFIVILQVSTDSQIKEGSEIKDNEKFIYKVIKNFAKANQNINLVFKHHPRDRGYTNYLNQIEKFSKEFGVYKKVFYIHDYFLSKIFKNPNCKGTVLINSTVGYQSLYHSVPVKSLGITPYNIEGLSDQRDLISFFKNPSIVDRLLLNKFYKYVLENSQINGNFDGFFPFKDVFIFKK